MIVSVAVLVGAAASPSAKVVVWEKISIDVLLTIELFICVNSTGSVMGGSASEVGVEDGSCDVVVAITLTCGFRPSNAPDVGFSVAIAVEGKSGGEPVLVCTAAAIGAGPPIENTAPKFEELWLTMATGYAESDA